ncbi:hypothetical protein [Streptomyces parvus]|uniref:Uncharacterized protein n=1 Tax=Streptomyces parvus TaxID=66428 RepID=A0A7K3S2N1_9ACTN|nr:hypothetical protein [Streptomyces parvus]NEC21192.1 hypothetical protein [Streptomyces parvus]NEE33134.1 hypothetical protein [Streptomyces sp. SID7982]
MSAMNRLDLDLIELGAQAVNAALLDTSAARLSALTAVFEECGERANIYFCPSTAAADLVRWAALDYQGARRAVRRRAVVAGV